MSLQKIVTFFKSRQLWRAVAAALIASVIIGIWRHLEPKPDASMVPNSIVSEQKPNPVSQITERPGEETEKKPQEERSKQKTAKELEKEKQQSGVKEINFGGGILGTKPTLRAPAIEAPAIKREHKPPVFISPPGPFAGPFRLEIVSVKRTNDSKLKFTMLIRSQERTWEMKLVEPEKTAYIVDRDGNRYFFADAGGKLSYQSYQEFPPDIDIKCYMTFLAPPPTVKEVSLIFKYEYGLGWPQDVTFRELNLETLKPDSTQDAGLSSPQTDINSAPTGEQQIEYEYKPAIFNSSRSGFSFEIISVKRSYDDSKLKFTMLIKSQKKTQLMKLVEPEETAYMVDSDGNKYFFVSTNLGTGREKEENRRPRRTISRKPPPSYEKLPADVGIQRYMFFLAPPPTVKKINLVFTFAYDAGNENWWSENKDDVIFKDLNLETLKLEATQDTK